MNYFLAILAVIGGTLMIWKTEWLVENFGTSAWAESKGIGTRFLYKIIGLIIIFIALAHLGGFLDNIIWAIFSPLFGKR